jgi:hypothetical protein
MAKSRTSGQGRPKGVPNRMTADLKGMILGALQDVGGAEYLARQANENPAAFLALIGKVLPTQVTGDGGGAVTVQVITGVSRHGDCDA